MLPARSTSIGWPRAANCLALSTAFGLLLGGGAATGSTTLPAATFQENVVVNVAGQGSADPDPATADQVTYGGFVMNGNGSAQLSGSAASAGGARPTVTATATANGGASFQVDGVVDTIYYFALSGPASATPIPIRITYSGDGSAMGPVADGLGRIRVDQLSSSQNLIFRTFGVSSVFGPATNAVADIVFATAAVGSVHSVRLEAQARAQAAGGLSQSAVTVDPLIEVDPAFEDADLYDVVYSANLPVPEPDASWLALASIGAISLLRTLRTPRLADGRAGLEH